MHDFFIKYLDIVFLFYGLSFVIMALAIILWLRIIRTSAFKLAEPLWLLAWFGIIHSVHEFIEMFVIIHGETVISKIITPVCLVISSLFLFSFGYRLINLRENKIINIRFVITVVVIFLVAVFFTGVTSANAWGNLSRYFFCFPGGIMSSIGFILYYRNNRKELKKLRVRKYFVLAAVFFCIYAIVTGLIVKKSNYFPASVINLEAFVNLASFPVQVVRGICALFIAFSIWNIMGIFETEELLKRNKLEEEKRLSEIGALAVTIAHELRNPLATINLAAVNIKKKAGNTLFDKHLNVIEKKVFQCDRIISNLLFYTRLRPPDYQNVNIHDILAECINHEQNQLSKRILFKTEIDSIKDILIDADQTQIEEIFYNILDNACDAVLGEEGSIEVKADMDENYIRVFIKDNGCGINKDDLERIFEPFFTTKGNGTGLGLTVSDQMINMHGGTMHIDSQPGEGTTIIITLPIKRQIITSH